MTRYPLEIFWSEEDKGFIAEAPDLPGCSAWGATEANAAREAQRAIAAWLEAAKAELAKLDAGTATGDRWQLEQRIRHAENQLTVSGRTTG